MSKIVDYVKKELISDGLFGCLFLLCGLLTQFIAYYLNDESLLSLVSGLSGIFAVVLCSQRKYSFWIFSWIQLITYVILAYEQRLYGEIAENVFYAVTMIVGMFLWKKNYADVVEAKKLTFDKLLSIICVMTAVICIVESYLASTDDSQPWLDSITTVPAVIAQMMLVFKYREQWIFWLIIDAASVYMWFVAGDYCMVMQYIFWTLNCLYGLNMWSK